MKFRNFEPKIDRGKQLYEQQSIKIGPKIEVRLIRSKTPHNIAKMIPWHFFVAEDESRRAVDRD